MRVKGLDSLRFISALWVTFYHLGSFPLTQGVDRSKTRRAKFSVLYTIQYFVGLQQLLFFLSFRVSAFIYLILNKIMKLISETFG
jgi:peptidoglycan/LPS O-acetylase OafA/YrhL